MASLKKPPLGFLILALILIVMVPVGAWRMIQGIGGGIGITTLSFLLIAVGIGLLAWSKAPAIGKSLGSWFLGAGVFLAVLLWLFGEQAIEQRRQQVQTFAKVAETEETTKQNTPPAKVYKEVDMRSVPDLVEKAVTISLNEGVTAIMPRREVSKAALLCANLPSEIVADLNRPYPWFTASSTNMGVRLHFALNSEMLTYMREKGRKQITLKLVLMPGVTTCP